MNRNLMNRNWRNRWNKTGMSRQAPPRTQRHPERTSKEGTSQTLGDGFSTAPSVLCFRLLLRDAAKSAAPSLATAFTPIIAIPFVAGGPTELSNAQALCPDCNRRKAARTLTQGNWLPARAARPPLPSWTLPLRPWQQRGVLVWERLRAQQAPLETAQHNMTGTNMTGNQHDHHRNARLWQN